MSLSVKPKEAQQEQRSAPAKKPIADLEDDLPFK
jgi:hypothetical protein